jgi:hypothetical protein
MAQVVEQMNGAPYPLYNVAGSLKQQFHNILSAASGDFMNVGLVSILKVTPDPGVITGYTTSQIGNGQSQIVFASSGPMANIVVEVIGN